MNHKLKDAKATKPAEDVWCVFVTGAGDYDTGYYDGWQWWDDDGTEMLEPTAVAGYLELPDFPDDYATGWWFKDAIENPPKQAGRYLVHGPGVGNNTGSSWSVYAFDPKDEAFGPWLSTGGAQPQVWSELPSLP